MLYLGLVSDGSGLNFFDPMLRSGRVKATTEAGKLPPKSANFSFFCPLGQRKQRLGQIKICPGQRQVGPFFTAGQNMLWTGQVGSAQGPSRLWMRGVVWLTPHLSRNCFNKLEGLH